MENFDIDDLIRHAIREANERLLFEEEKRIELLYEAFHCIISADKGRLFQVITNLIDNAVKFTDQGKVSITVTRIANKIEVEIKDTGSGINSQIMPKLFSKFVTTSENGTGLGLFISKNIIEAHGGIIWAENNTGKGATFKFRIPID
jgi:signal transduction histidine kinase